MADIFIIGMVVITLVALANQQWHIIKRNRVVRARYWEHVRRSRKIPR